MQVPKKLSDAFGQPFEELIQQFVRDRGLLPDDQTLRSPRFISRSLVPHIEKLSALFNREEGDQADGLNAYWKQSSNPENLRLAYFLYFMPCNLFRMASVWAELARLGYRWPEGAPLKGIEFGAGPAAGAAGIAAGEHHAPLGLPAEGSWALIEQDRSMLELGSEWVQTYFANQGFPDWGPKPFHRKLELKTGFLPRSAPKFNLWLMSFFLNEFSEPTEEVARTLLDSWDRHLEDDSLILIVEPALRLQSRRLLELRQALIKVTRERAAKPGARPMTPYTILTPCLGEQACGALAVPTDWCHEEVSWWRPPYFRQIDQMAGLDRKTLPFSYLAIARSSRPREELLPKLRSSPPSRRFRLVSPAHAEGRDLEFYVCGEAGKRKTRFRAPKGDPLVRGDILLEADIRGDIQAGRIDRLKKLESDPSEGDPR